MSEQTKGKRPEERDAVYTTIVGGRPPGCGTAVGAIPRGLEVLVKKAAVDDEFKALLLDNRAGAAREIGLVLDPAEAAMLGVIPRAQLEATVARTTVRPENRRAFLGQAAALMLAALGAQGLTGCTDKPEGQGRSAGVAPGTPPPPQTPTPTPKLERPTGSGGAGARAPQPITGVQAERPISGIQPQPPVRIAGARPASPEQMRMLGTQPQRPEIVKGVRIEKPERVEIVEGIRIEREVRPDTTITISGVMIERPAEEPRPRVVRGTRPARPDKPDESVTMHGIRPAPKKEE